ncbi:MAG TPA: hypothetical protein VKF36_11680 [Syntrophorhabdales bacterium]|nr:hypothetical protein [Syntrophorhabdales bacterium]
MKKFIGFMVMVSVVVSLCCLWAVQAEAAPIPGLYDTGVNSSNALLSAGATDPHYMLTQSVDPSFPGPNAIVVGPATAGNPTAGYPFTPNGPWMDNASNSQWIAPQEYVYTGVPTGNGMSAGAYTYTTTFNLAGLNPATAVITGEWAADDEGLNILINGNSTGLTYNAEAYGSFQSFTISSGFVSGVNTLAFEVGNIALGPTGLQVDNLSGTASPVREPVSLLLFGAGLVGMAVIGRRNERRAT